TGSGLAGAPTLQVGSNPPVAGTFSSPNWNFNLDASLAPAGAEGPLAFTINAQDNVGNVTNAPGSRNIDDKAPTIAIATDTNWYARTLQTPTPGAADIIPITVTITDNGSGVATSPAPTIQVGSGTPVAGTAGSGNSWTF